MNDKAIRVLLVEDSSSDALILKETLKRATSIRVEITVADVLEKGLALMAHTAFDMVLLDLMLPDSMGLDTFVDLHGKFPHVPVIIVTGLGDEEVAIQAVRRGAQDYLSKNHLDPELLSRAVRYAMERGRLLEEVKKYAELLEGRKQELENELRFYEQIFDSSSSFISADGSDHKPFKERTAAQLARWVQRYEALLDLALEQRTFKIDHNISDDLRALGRQMGILGAGPRDVVQLHSTALANKREEGNPKKDQAYTEEGRFLILELMGHLVSYYRDLSRRNGDSV